LIYLRAASIKQSQLLMPSNITAQQYGQAVLDHVQTGAYPESEEVIANDLPPSALADVSSVIQRARSDLRVACLSAMILHASLIVVGIGQYQGYKQGMCIRHRWVDITSETAAS